MRFTNAFSLIAASALFASVNAITPQEDIASMCSSLVKITIINWSDDRLVALSRLQNVNTELFARDVDAEPATIT